MPTATGIAGTYPTLWAVGLVAVLALGSGGSISSLVAPTGPVPSPSWAPRDDGSAAVASWSAVGSPGPGSVGPLARPAAGAVDPFAGAVNPYGPRTAEPAPMGIADFGVSPVPGGYAAYSYSTPEWRASINISKLAANDGSTLPGHGDVSFQLNVVLTFGMPGGTSYTYWVQDVASVDSMAARVQFIDNIWNMSSVVLDSHSVRGNGTVNQNAGLDWYADVPAFQNTIGGFAGNCVVVPFPAHVVMQVRTGLFGGVPHVTFEYGDELGGWVAYDNASFPFARGASNPAFIVDGSRYTPIGLYYDAELDYTGPGGTMIDQGSRLELALDYWNGHNLEAPSTTFNFGANTAEQIQNVVVHPLASAKNGCLWSNVTEGAGSLGPLYTRANVSVLNITSPDVATGTVVIGGAATAFVGGEAVLTLAPGSYAVALEWANGTVVALTIVTLVPGGHLHLALATPPTYPVTVTASGLAPGVPWTLHLAGQTHTLDAAMLTVDLTNGSYPWSVDPVAGYTTDAYAGRVLVQGAAAELIVSFNRVTYTITFLGEGLPDGTPWTVIANGTAFQGNGTSIVVTEPNGSFAYVVQAGRTYTAEPSTGSVNVVGVPLIEIVAFSLRPGYLVGHVDPAGASLTVDGSPEPTGAGQFNVSLPPGTYQVAVGAAGYAPYFTNGTVTAGSLTSLDVSLPALAAPSSGGLVAGSLAWTIAIGAAAGAVAAIAAVAWARQRRR